VWPLCLPVTHCTQTEIAQLSQRKIKSSLCSSHLNFTSGTTVSLVRNEMKSKLDVFQTNEKQIEEGLTTFDLSVTSVIKALTEEGLKLKAMIDRHIEKMIATLREKAKQEKEPSN
jgi:hypothetical protein